MSREKRRLELLNRLPKGGVCAEIGVWEGGFSEKILDVTQPKTLHLIDPWLFQPEFNNSAFGKEARRTAMDDMFDHVVDKFAADDRVVIHRKMSHDALESFDDHALDWVYIDGNHNFEVVSRDLALSARKVKPGGMIGGDDLLWNVDNGAPVRTAVRALRRKLGDRAAFYRMGQQYLFELSPEPEIAPGNADPNAAVSVTSI